LWTHSRRRHTQAAWGSPDHVKAGTSYPSAGHGRCDCINLIKPDVCKEGVPSTRGARDRRDARGLAGWWRFG